MEFQRVSVVVLGHSFVRRAIADIKQLLDRTETVAWHDVMKHSGMRFGDAKFESFLSELSALNLHHPLIVICFLGDNDLFPKGSDDYQEKTLPLGAIAHTFGAQLRRIKEAANTALVYWITPAVRKNRPNYNGMLPYISYSMAKYVVKKRWLHVFSREGRGGSDPSGLCVDGIHPKPCHHDYWITNYISMAIDHYFSTTY